MSTFAELGIPFPLFEAPTHEACHYVAGKTCRLCGREGRHCFGLSGGDDFVLPCPVCGAENTYPGRLCRSCGAPAFLSSLLQADTEKHEPIPVCYDCVRSGKATIGKGTEFGYVTREEAVAGVTRSWLNPREGDQFEIVTLDQGEDWYGARIPSEHLWELLRTPSFYTWQDDEWLFCCRRPMVYMGGWRSVKDSVPRKERTAFFKSLFEPGDQAISWGPETFEGGSPFLYAFRCRECGRRRAYYDAD